MSRPAAASFTVAPVALPDIDYPEPPAEFNEDQAEQWRSVVHGLPPDYFKPEMLPLLSSLCVAASISRDLVARINALTAERPQPENFAVVYKELLYLLLEQAKCVVGASTKLRLTPQSRYGTKEAFNKSKKVSTAAPSGPRATENTGTPSASAISAPRATVQSGGTGNSARIAATMSHGATTRA